MRKIILAFAVLAGTVSMLNAQDVITLKNGNETQAKVLEIGTTDITYKQFSNQSGPTYTEKKSNVFRIVDAEGRILFINQTSTPPPSPPQPYDGGSGSSRSSSDVERKGYVSVTLGAAVVTEEYSDIDVGAEFTLNAAYLFAKNVGVDATFLYTTYSSDDDFSVSATGFFIGPLISFANSSKKIEFDFKPQIGTSKIKSHGDVSFTFKTKFSYGGGFSVRFNITDRIAVSGNANYYSIVAKDSKDINLSHIGISGGFHIRF
jgi:hypothetical protein